MSGIYGGGLEMGWDFDALDTAHKQPLGSFDYQKGGSIHSVRLW